MANESETKPILLWLVDGNNSLASNSSLNSTSSEGLLETFPPGPLYLGVVLGILISIIGVLGNSVTIAALLLYPQTFKNATTSFIINLAIVDLMFCAIGPPLTAVTFLNKKWILPESLCAVQGFVQFLNTTVSMFTMTAIAVNRYILIAHPRIYNRVYTNRILTFKIASLWVIGFVLWFPSLLGRWGKFGFDLRSGRCTLLHSECSGTVTAFPFIACMLLIQGAIIIFCYLRIFCIVRKSKENFTPTNRRTGSRSSSSEKQQKRSRRNLSVKLPLPVSRKYSNSSSADCTEDVSSGESAADMRILRISFVIICIFFVSFMPIVIVRIANLQKKAPAFYILAYLSLSLSAFINPAVYFFMSKEYRSAYKALFAASPSLPYTTDSAASKGFRREKQATDYSHSSNTGSISV